MRAVPQAPARASKRGRKDHAEADGVAGRVGGLAQPRAERNLGVSAGSGAGAISSTLPWSRSHRSWKVNAGGLLHAADERVVQHHAERRAQERNPLSQLLLDEGRADLLDQAVPDFVLELRFRERLEPILVFRGHDALLELADQPPCPEPLLGLVEQREADDRHDQGLILGAVQLDSRSTRATRWTARSASMISAGSASSSVATPPALASRLSDVMISRLTSSIFLTRASHRSSGPARGR